MLAFDDFLAARAELCRRLAASRAARFDREIHGPEFDDDEMLGAIEDPPGAPVAFHLIYRDAKGDLSGRCVTVQSAKAEISEIRVWAYCHMRKALRAFLASRIMEVTDLATGEVDDDGLEYFRHYPLLQNATADSLSAVTPELIAVQECRDEIIILSAVAACDGFFDEREADEIVKHVLNRFPDEEVSEAGIRRRIASWIPDERAFSHALDRLCAGEGDAHALMKSLRALVDADGVLDPEECVFVSEIEGRLRAAGRFPHA